jgi:hypothetical protein
MSFPAKVSALLILSAHLGDAFQGSNWRMLQSLAAPKRAGTAFPKSNTISDSRLYLELSDILDDDSSEFLEALRRQMDGTNILNASPREITNRIKGFFAISKRSPEEILHFKKVRY